MNTTQFVKALAVTLGVSQKKAKEIYEGVVDTATEGVKTHGKVSLKGLGKFEVKQRAQRNGRNPQTGEALVIPAKTVVKATAKIAL